MLDMEEDVEIPLILGRPFLATGKALIDMQKRKLLLRVGDEEITFDVFNALKHSAHDENCSSIDIMNSLVFNLVQDPVDAILTNTLTKEDFDDERAEVVEYFEANPPWKKQVRFKLEELGERRNLTPPKPSIEDPPILELKPLPSHLKYVYLDEKNNLPVIISSSLTCAMEEKLVEVLKAHKNAFAWKVTDIKDINPSVCVHKILMEEKYSPLVQP